MKYFLTLLLLISSSALAFRTANISVIKNGNMGLSTIIGSSTILGSPNIVSNSILLDQVEILSIQASVGDSTAEGSLSVQASNDMGLDTQGNGVTNWTNIAGSSTAVVGTSSYLLNFPDNGYRWGRVIYTRTSGSGPLNVRANVKGN